MVHRVANQLRMSKQQLVGRLSGRHLDAAGRQDGLRRHETTSNMLVVEHAVENSGWPMLAGLRKCQVSRVVREFVEIRRAAAAAAGCCCGTHRGSDSVQVSGSWLGVAKVNTSARQRVANKVARRRRRRRRRLVCLLVAGVFGLAAIFINYMIVSLGRCRCCCCERICIT